MISVEQSKMYSEVYQILEILGDEYKSLLPKDIIETINNNRMTDYTPIYDSNIPLNEQNISKKTSDFLCMLHYNYWCKDAKEKKVLDEILDHNEEKRRKETFEYQEKFKEKNEKNVDNNVLVVKDNWIKKIVNNIKGFFNRFRA